MRTTQALLASAVVTLALGCTQNRPPATPAQDEPGPRSFNPPAASPDDASVASAIRVSRDQLRIEAARSPAIGERKPFYGTSTSPAGQILAKSDTPLSDAQILGVVLAADDGEVQVSEFVIRRASDPDVRQFAATVKTSHAAALQKARTIETRTKNTSAESDISTYLKNDAESTLRNLHTTRGRTLDEAYVDSRVKAQSDVLLAIDNRLTPSAANGEVKALLGELRRIASDHLAKAEDLKKKIHEVAAESSVRAKAAPPLEQDSLPPSRKWKHDIGPINPLPRR